MGWMLRSKNVWCGGSWQPANTTSASVRPAEARILMMVLQSNPAVGVPKARRAAGYDPRLCSHTTTSVQLVDGGLRGHADQRRLVVLRGLEDRARRLVTDL